MVVGEICMFEYVIQGVSQWDSHFVELTCVEISNKLPPYFECF